MLMRFARDALARRCFVVFRHEILRWRVHRAIPTTAGDYSYVTVASSSRIASSASIVRVVTTVHAKDQLGGG